MVPGEQDLVRFVLREARLLDERRYDEWYDLFAADGIYWVPASPDQPDGVNHASLAYEDRLLLRIRIERLKVTPLSQRPPSRGHHLLQTPAADGTIGAAHLVRTQFQYTEARGDEQRSYVGTAVHHLVVEGGDLRIRLKRVDLLNCDAALPGIQLFI
jgi:3-phenylpropionate/cinnamic acid dioxygenase small subunit